MKYALVIHETAESRRRISSDRAAFRGHYEAWIGDIAAAGKLLGGEAFDTESAAPVTVRTDADGNAVATPGPVHEGEVTLGGWFVLDVADQAEAVELASRLGTPEAIEIRPILESA